LASTLVWMSLTPTTRGGFNNEGNVGEYLNMYIICSAQLLWYVNELTIDFAKDSFYSICTAITGNTDNQIGRVTLDTLIHLTPRCFGKRSTVIMYQMQAKSSFKSIQFEALLHTHQVMPTSNLVSVMLGRIIIYD
jgi:hypothetical protein